MFSRAKNFSRTDPKFAPLWNMIGNTPMVEILYAWKGTLRSVFAKCEYYNLTGSLKDRMALYILQQAYLIGALSPGDTIVEATSGCSGISLASIARWLGHPVIMVMPDWLSSERYSIIRSLGAEVIPISREKGGFPGSIHVAEEMARLDRSVFLPRQFSNVLNAEVHEYTTAHEIGLQLAAKNITMNAFVAGVGTGGTIMGVGRYVKRRTNKIFVHPLEPEEAGLLTSGRKKGSHRIQGIVDDFVPPLLKLNELDSVVSVKDGDAICAARMLASQLGLAVGISSGANFLGAVNLQNRMGGAAKVVTVFCDSNKKYLSTDLMKEEPVQENYLSANVRLLEYRTIARLNTTVL